MTDFSFFQAYKVTMLERQKGGIPYVGDPWPDHLARNYCMTGVKAKPIYKSYWRWITRRPLYWDVTYSFESIEKEEK